MARGKCPILGTGIPYLLWPGSRDLTPTNTNSSSGGLYGLDAFNASRPIADHGWQAEGREGILSEPRGALQQEPVDPFTGKGELLEADDATVFKAVQALVMRQEPLAKNRLAMDKHWTAVKAGYQFSSLTKQDNQDVYTQTWPAGYGTGLRVGAVPNKQADLCQKLTETLLTDPPRLDPEATTDDEAAQRGADLAREFLTQDATEAGMDDVLVFGRQIEGATTRASTFNHYWVDPSGGGSIPKQVKAHPQATDAANPLDAVDGATGQPIPTTDYVLRYVTPEAQFTENPAEAEKVWLPKIRVDLMAREHVRLYPETADLAGAQRVICLWYATVEECKRRWPETVGAMTDAELTGLCAWTPPRPAVLLPSALRSRWRGERATPSGDGGSLTADERLVFFYLYYHRQDPTYPEGAAIAVNGYRNGYVFGKDTLSATVEVPTGEMQDQTVTDTKPMDFPLAQVRLLPDAEDGDPTGKAFMARIGGAGEAYATMATAMMEAIDITLHPARYATATSPVSSDDVESSRATGDFVTVITKDDFPKYEDPRDLPGAFFEFIGWLGEGMDSIASLNKPAQGSDDSPEVSGIARRIAVQQSLVGLSRMQQAVHSAWQRHGRVKLQLAMKHFSVPQLLRYVGTDGVAKQEWFTGNDFARVGNITIASGTGTLMPPTERVNYVLQLRDAGLLEPEQAMEVSRPAFAKTLGVMADPHLERIERQISSWLEGPPERWEEQAMAYQAAVLQHAELSQATLASDADAPIPPPPTAPWTPFAVEPVDAEPSVANLRRRRLGFLMAKVEFSEQPEPWKQVVRDAYQQAAQSAQAALPQPQQAGAQVQAPTSPTAGMVA